MDQSSPFLAKPQAALSQQAFERLEASIVSCSLPPGRSLSILELQATTGLGRTPTHLAVTRLAADTLIVIRPRHGLRIAPIDLDRERTLMGLRRDLERFVVKLAIARADDRHHLQLRRLRAELQKMNALDPVDLFNDIDQQLNQLLLEAAGEPFLQHSLRPLQTMSRRTGWLFFAAIRPEESLRDTLDCHRAILDAVIEGGERDALAATERLLDLSQTMFDVLARHGDPTLFDCTLGSPRIRQP